MSIKRALIDVQDRTGLVNFATALVNNNVEIYAYEATAKYLKRNKIPVSQIPHDKNIAGVDPTEHISTEETSPYFIDLYVTNIPDIEEIINKPGQSHKNIMDSIEIEAVCFIRLVAKQCENMTPVISPSDYEKVITDLETGKLENKGTRIKYAQKAFGFVSKYDSIVSQYLFLNIS